MENNQETNYVLTLSAGSVDQLEVQIEKLKLLLKLASPTTPFRDLALSITLNDQQLEPCRFAIVAKSVKQVLEKLQREEYHKGTKPSSDHKLCFLYSGYSGANSNKSFALYDAHVGFREIFDYYTDQFKSKFPGKENFLEIIRGQSEMALEDPAYTILLTQLPTAGLSKVWETAGIRPDIVLGHSLGEYHAAYEAGLMKREEVTSLFSFFPEQRYIFDKGGMVVLPILEEKVKAILVRFKKRFRIGNEWLEIVSRNSPVQFVLGGSPNALGWLMRFCNDGGIPYFEMPVKLTYHSKAMDPMLPKMEELTKTMEFRRNKADRVFISTKTGKCMETLPPDHWVKHIRDPVNFVDAVNTAADNGATVFVQVGEGNALLSMASQCLEKRPNFSKLTFLPSTLEKLDELETLLSSNANLYVKGFKVNWESFFTKQDQILK